MKERINRLARGMLDMDIPQISGLPEKIVETVLAGKTETREFLSAVQIICTLKAWFIPTIPG